MTRRSILVGLGAAAAAAAASVRSEAVERNDAAVDRYLKSQASDGSVPDEFNLHSAGAAAGLIDTLTASLVCEQSRFFRNREVARRIGLAAKFLERSQSSEGFIDLLSTNFDSPPDTGFVVHPVASAASNARQYGAADVLAMLRPFLEKAARGLSVGGIHTPNHRWVVSSALAQVNALWPDPAYTRRIGQWLAEGIDIDEDGQFIERSTVTYNTVVDRAFVVMAVKLGRPELLDPVRANLRSMMYLLHPDGEVVTDVSRRQDQFVRGTMAGYWLPVWYLAMHDHDGQFAALARMIGAERVPLSALLEYPELNGALPDAAPLPSDYERLMKAIGLVRVRRGKRDATIVLGGNSRFLSMRSGGVVVQAVRFATSFFGKGQFVPTEWSKVGDAYRLGQTLQAAYYQPVEEHVTAANWAAMRGRRKESQVCRLEQSAVVEETRSGFAVRIESKGTPGVPLAIEVSLREGGKLEGCRPAPRVADAWILEKDFATYRVRDGVVRFGPGTAPHSMVELRGAEPKLPGMSVYLTGYTPVSHRLEFDLG